MKHAAVKCCMMAALLTLSACSVPPEALVATPLVYQKGFEPGPSPHAYEPSIEVFFATTREPNPQGEELPYGNEPSRTIRVGRTRVVLGDESWDHERVKRATLDIEREEVPEFLLVETWTHGEIGSFHEELRDEQGRPAWTVGDAAGEHAAALREAVAGSADRSLLVFVDGTKGNFYRANALAAEAHHLLGRAMPVLTFSWPSHQNIYSYVWGSDERRADEAGLTFAAIMDWAAEHSGAERIHVLSYSAGGRVASIGLAELRQRHIDLSGPALRNRLPLGVALFAAADEPIDRFLTEAPDIHEIVERLVVTISQRDQALILSRLLRGEGQRLGNERWNGPSEAEMQLLRDYPHVEFVDVSYGRESRGFKIKGHHYWYRQPWVVSDVIMALRTGQPGDERGLIEEVHPHVYGFTAEYPERLRAAAKRHLVGTTD